MPCSGSSIRARASSCAARSRNTTTKNPETGPRLLSRLIVKQARAEGFLVFQFAPRYAEGLKQMAAWLKAGKLKYREQFVDGIENTPRAFIGMLQGENTGKQLVRVAKE